MDYVARRARDLSLGGQDSSKGNAVETGCSGLPYIIDGFTIWYHPHPLHPPPTAPPCDEYPSSFDFSDKFFPAENIQGVSCLGVPLILNMITTEKYKLGQGLGLKPETSSTTSSVSTFRRDTPPHVNLRGSTWINIWTFLHLPCVFALVSKRVQCVALDAPTWYITPVRNM